MIATVSRAEANLLTLARAAVGLVPTSDVLRLLGASVTPPDRLGPTARRILSQTLGRGTVLTLARQGGWQLEGGTRLWDRVAPPALDFTPNLILLLQWLLKTPLAEPATPTVRGTLSLADSIIATSLLDRLRGTGYETALATQPALRASPLVALAHVVDLARVEPLTIPSLAPLLPGVAIEGLRSLLTRSWVQGELTKRDLTDPATLHRVGAAQEQLLEAYLALIETAQARHLATFLIDAAAEWLRPGRTADELWRALDPQAPLRERMEARRQATAFLRVFSRLRTWDHEHRATRFIDDGYEVAQNLVGRWERLGDPGFNTLEQLAVAVDALV